MALAVGLSIAVTPSFAQRTPEGEGADQASDIVVQATRNGHNVQDQPIRVEVLDREEVEEKQLMTPGNIAMRFSETPGLHVQVTSPALGGPPMCGYRG